ncbi:MAG: DUF892 family protein [Legionellales bacterium]|nr:DUF892 family protein [Legionellales bacterium]
MVTKVGLQANFVSALKDLIELDYDAIEAYDAAIKRLENPQYATTLNNFRQDHQDHVTTLSSILSEHGEEAPTGPSIGKQWIAKGKVVLADLAGDHAILMAMKSNEEDTNTAYQRLNDFTDKWPDTITALSKGLDDEKKHKAWIEGILNQT